MKFLSTFFLITCFCFSLNAQNAFFTTEIDQITIEGSAKMETFYDHISLLNISGNKLKIKWERIEEIVPEGWTSSVCDNMVCHEPDTNSSLFDLPANPEADVDFVNMHFYPNGVEGSARVKVLVYVFGYKEDGIILTYHGTTNGALIESTETVEVLSPTIKAYPNPTTDFLHLQVDHTWLGGELQIINMMGQMIRSTLLSDVEVKLDIQSLPKGNYILHFIQKRTQVSHKQIISKA